MNGARRNPVLPKKPRGEGEAGMDEFATIQKYSPYRFFSAAEWAGFRADTPLTLT